jgi:hypothetical protein
MLMILNLKKAIFPLETSIAIYESEQRNILEDVKFYEYPCDRIQILLKNIFIIQDYFIASSAKDIGGLCSK